MDILHSENCQIGWQAGRFYRVKNKEEEEKKKISDWLGLHGIVWDEKKQELVWLTGYTTFLVKWNIYRTMNVSIW